LQVAEILLVTAMRTILTQISSKAEEWVVQHVTDLIDLGVLWAGLEFASRVLLPAPLPWAAQLVALTIGAGIPERATEPNVGFWARWRANLPRLILVAAAIAFIFFLWLDLPKLALIFVPVWLALGLTSRLACAVVLSYSPDRRNALFEHFRSIVLQHRFDIALGETVVLGSLLWASQQMLTVPWPSAGGLVFTVLAWSGFHVVTHWHCRGALLSRSATVLTALSLGLLGWAHWHGGVTRGQIVVVFWISVAFGVYRLALAATARRLGESLSENLRWIALALAALWLFHSLVQKQLYGAGDALWYGTMLADMLAQVRAGVFPVFVGQSIFQFNGAIYPLRVAPAFHYLGVAVDLLTGRALGVFAVQNILLISCGCLALATSYGCLAALAPGRRWLACALAVLFISCPGVLSIVYNVDLFMSWTTVPIVPLVWFAVVRSFRGGGLGTMLCLGAALGALWWGHSPIALWIGLLAGTTQLLRLAVRWPGWRGLAQACAGGALFGMVAAFPIISVLHFPPEPGQIAMDFQRATAGNIMNFLREVFPAVLLPVSRIATLLSDFQLGYSLWFLFLFSLWQLRRERLPEYRVLLAAAAVLVVMLTPIPVLDFALWSAVPGFVRNTTGNWVMNRLYLVLSSLIVFAMVAWIGPKRNGSRWLSIALSLACAWSLAEAGKFDGGARVKQRPPGSEVNLLRPENVTLTRFAYLVFPKLPDSFTHAPVDPQMENRLRPADTLAFVDTNLNAALAAGRLVTQSDFVWPINEEPNLLRLATTLRLEPGQRYLLQFTFAELAKAQGMIEITGKTFFRDYALPDYGGTKSFGAGGEHASAISVWTSSTTAEEITVRFYPAAGAGPVSTLVPFAQVRLLAYNEADLPVRVESWIPYRALVRSGAAAWLETPRMFQTSYVARVNGVPAEVRKSPDGLVSVAVPRGESQVDLAYHTPLGLKLAWWLSILAITAALIMAAGYGWHTLLATTGTFLPGTMDAGPAVVARKPADH